MVQYTPASLFDEASNLTWPSRKVLIVLNQPLHDLQVFARVWQHCEFAVCADGGANHLYDMMGKAADDRNEQYLPRAVVGDLDSLRDDVRDFYASRNVDIVHESDQESTDFGKSMRYVLSKVGLEDLHEIVILGSLGGRVDHGLGLLHEMFREKLKNETLQLWLFSETNISFIVEPGQHVILVPSWQNTFTKTCGILPQYGKAVITTGGLRWDVQEWTTENGGNVSTSNHLSEETIKLRTDRHVLFTLERKS